MDNWWLDETPCPGPAFEPPVFGANAYASYGHSIIISKQIARLLRNEYREKFKALGLAAEDAAKALRDAGWVTYPPDDEPMTLEERKEHALQCRKNRNTGPSAEWGFHRDGRRTI